MKPKILFSLLSEFHETDTSTFDHQTDFHLGTNDSCIVNFKSGKLLIEVDSQEDIQRIEKRALTIGGLKTEVADLSITISLAPKS